MGCTISSRGWMDGCFVDRLFGIVEGVLLCFSRGRRVCCVCGTLERGRGWEGRGKSVFSIELVGRARRGRIAQGFTGGGRGVGREGFREKGSEWMGMTGARRGGGGYYNSRWKANLVECERCFDFGGSGGYMCDCILLPRTTRSINVT